MRMRNVMMALFAALTLGAQAGTVYWTFSDELPGVINTASKCPAKVAEVSASVLKYF